MRRAGIDQSTKRSRIKMTSSPDKETEVQTSDQDPKSVKGLIDSQYETRYACIFQSAFSDKYARNER